MLRIFDHIALPLLPPLQKPWNYFSVDGDITEYEQVVQDLNEWKALQQSSEEGWR